MKTYNFTEATSIANALFTNKYGEHSTSVAGVIKPLPIGSVSFLSKSAPLLIRRKVQMQLNKVMQLEKKLRYQMSNSKYDQIKQKNQIDLDFVTKAHTIHQQYYSKVLYLKGKYRIVNANMLNTLQHAYERRMFMLNQEYQKSKLQNSPYSVQNVEGQIK